MPLTSKLCIGASSAISGERGTKRNEMRREKEKRSLNLNALGVFFFIM
jgi:hypothetical protein